LLTSTNLDKLRDTCKCVYHQSVINLLLNRGERTKITIPSVLIELAATNPKLLENGADTLIEMTEVWETFTCDTTAESTVDFVFSQLFTHADISDCYISANFIGIPYFGVYGNSQWAEVFIHKIPSGEFPDPKFSQWFNTLADNLGLLVTYSSPVPFLSDKTSERMYDSSKSRINRPGMRITKSMLEYVNVAYATIK